MINLRRYPIWLTSLWLAFFIPAALATTCGSDWQLIDLQQIDTPTSVVYGGDKFVAVGYNGTVLTSPDGITWTSQTSGTTSSLSGVTWGGNQFVAVGDSGTILTSPDGITWTSQTSEITHWLLSVTWGNNQFVASGAWFNWDSYAYVDTILTSPDGINWTSQISYTAIYGITWGNNQFVAVGSFDPNGVYGDSNSNINILTSSDGISWTSQIPTTGSLSGSLYGITWGNNQFIAVGDYGTIFTSLNGITWTSRISGTTNSLFGVTWGNNQFVAVGGYGTVITSPDGITWTLRISGTTNSLFDVTWGNNQFVAVGAGGTILRSVCSTTPSSFIVTPSAGTGGAISPNTVQTVNYGATKAFTVTPNAGYGIASVSGCGGNLSGNTYTTGAITGDCAIFAAFKNNSQSSGINDTNIITCSDASQNGLPCPVPNFPRQDAEYGPSNFNFTKLDVAGSALPDTATDHTCVRDNYTGLIWEVKTDDGGLRDKDNRYTFDQAAAFAVAVNATGGLCGFTNWRVPNPQELISLVDFGMSYPGPTINANYFPNSPGTGFWTNSLYAADASSAWIVYFNYGYINYYSRANSGAVRLVHGEQALSSFHDNGDGTITDANTGLTWAQCAQGQSGTTCVGTATTMSWGQALNVATTSTLAGYDDWRLPNVKELSSIVDYSRYNPSVSTTYFPNVPMTRFWSSSPYAYVSSNAWFVSFNNGYDSAGSKPSNNVVRLVRRGQFLPSFLLSVGKVGNGNGDVTSDPAGIDCGNACTASFGYNAVVTLTAVPNTNSMFSGWSGDCTGVVGACTVTMNAAKNVVATFIPNSYTVTPSAGTGGIIGPNTAQTVNYGATTYFTISPDTGYSINSVDGCGGSLSGNIYTTGPITADCTVIVTFIINSYTVTPSAGTGGAISPNTVQTVNYGATKAFTVTPNAGYGIASVSGCGGNLSGNTYTTGAITGDCAIFAAFKNNSQSSGINDTNIITCSDASQNGLPCPVPNFPRQDAEYGPSNFNFTKLDVAGSALPDTATDHTCVRDNYTGLIWEVKTDDGGLRDKDNRYTFDQAAAFAVAVNATGGLCGFTNWRVPNPQELISLVDFGMSYPGPTINANYFPNSPGTGFWTNSLYAADASSAWIVYFNYGYINYYSRANSGAVRLVHGEQALSSFHDNGDGTITDANTGLTWAQCAQGQSGTTCVGTATTMSWGQALNVATTSTLAGYDDWRLPNVKELSSIVDYSRYNPSVSTTYFPNVPMTRFWSSSPYAYVSSNAWFVSFNNGYDSAGSKPSNNVVRLVRRGQFLPSFLLSVGKVGNGNGDVTSDPAGIDCGNACTASFGYNAVVTLTAVPNTNSMFSGWSGDCTGVVGACTVTMNAAKNVVATFIPNSYTVTPSAGTGGIIGPNTAQTVNYGATTYFTISPDTGYSINSVDGCGGSLSGNIYTTGPITADCTVIVTFIINSYTVTPSAGTGGTISPNTPQTVTYGSTKAFTVTPNTGYSIASVNGCGGSLSGNTYTTGAITANCTVTASFSLTGSSYTVTPIIGKGGTVTPSTPQTVTANTTKSFTVVSKVGYIKSPKGISGTCPKGSWSSNIWTTGAINANCSVNFDFLCSACIPSQGGWRATLRGY